MTCNWPIAQGHFSSSGNIKWWWHTSNAWILPGLNSIELYVEKDTVSNQMHEGHGEFTCMLDLDIESTSFMPSIYIICKWP